MDGFAYHAQRGIVMTLEGNYSATVHLPEARFETDFADSCVYLPKTGVEVIVVFINGDQNRPVIINRLPIDEEVGGPLVELAGGGTAIALKGSEVQVDLTTGKGTITTGSTIVTSG